MRNARILEKLSDDYSRRSHPPRDELAGQECISRISARLEDKIAYRWKLLAASSLPESSVYAVFSRFCYLHLILQTEGTWGIALCELRSLQTYIRLLLSAARVQYTWLQLRQYCLLCLCRSTTAEANRPGGLTFPLLLPPKPLSGRERNVRSAKYNTVTRIGR